MSALGVQRRHASRQFMAASNGQRGTLGIDGLQTGMMLPDILFRFLLMNSNGLGPTTRWIKSMLLSKGGIAAVNVPKLFARVCMDTKP